MSLQVEARRPEARPARSPRVPPWRNPWRRPYALAAITWFTRQERPLPIGVWGSVLGSILLLVRHRFAVHTLALGLGKQGYQTEFVYGGEAHFDNMRGFFTGNGFQKVVDRRDMKPVFEGSWGASDEDLFDKSLQRLNVPSRLVVFPDEGHWILKPQNRELWWQEVHGWLEKYLTP